MDADRATLQDVLEPVGLRLSGRTEDVLRRAQGAQLWRQKAGATSVAEVTRSTALWAALDADSEAREAAEAAGFHVTKFASSLELSDPPGPEVEPVSIHERLREAVGDYVAAGDAAPAFTPLDLARASVRSAHDGDEAGLIARRIAASGVEPAALELALFGAAFSRSVRGVRRTLGPSSSVSAIRIARALQEGHSRYGGDTFGSVDLGADDEKLPAWSVTESSEAPMPIEEAMVPTEEAELLQEPPGVLRAVDDWLQRVRSCYDPDQISDSRHQVIDGELTLLALSRLDDALAKRMHQAGFLERLQQDVDVIPVQAQSSAQPTLNQAWTQWSDDDVDLDCASIEQQDRLGRRYLAKALATRLRSLEDTPGTFMVHIDGPWGAGKSTLLSLLKCELWGDHVIVEINAWREQRVGIQWWTLYKALRQGVRRRATGRLRGWYGVGVDAIATQWLPFVAGLLGVVGVAFFLVSADFDLTVGASNVDTLVKLVGGLGVLAAGVTAFVHYLLPETRRSAQGFVNNSSNPMGKVQALFRRTLERARYPVVLLIDDLDRCDPDYVIEFLEVVQTLVRPAGGATTGDSRRNAACGPYAFIAADGQWLRSSYEGKYAEANVDSVPGRPLGYRFLEKIFQLQLRLPSVPRQTKEYFYRSLLQLAPPNSEPAIEARESVAAHEARVDQASTSDEITRAAVDAHEIKDPQKRIEVLGRAAVRLAEKGIAKETEHALSTFSAYLEPNPRGIRLFVNTFGIQQSLRVLEEVDVAVHTLARWTVIEVRWPQLADHLRRHPDDLTPTENGGVAEGVPEAIKELLLDPEIRDVVDSNEFPRLTADDVRLCTGASSQVIPGEG